MHVEGLPVMVVVVVTENPVYSSSGSEHRYRTGTVVLSVCASVTSPVWAPRWRLKAAKALWRKTTVVGTVRRLFCQ